MPQPKALPLCSICSRQLKSPESIAAGMGKVCAAKIGRNGRRFYKHKDSETIEMNFGDTMTDKIKHTELPWIYTGYSKANDAHGIQPENDKYGNNYYVALTYGLNREANSAFIVKAVNNHYRLVEMVKELASDIGMIETVDGKPEMNRQKLSKFTKAQVLLTELEK